MSEPVRTERLEADLPCRPGPGRARLGRAQSVLSRDGAHLDYLFYRGRESRPDSPFLVCVHGLKRNPVEQIFRLAPLADRLGLVLIAPHFSRARFRHFQWLEPAEDGSLPEDLFDATLADSIERFRLEPGSHNLLGFSGGGQFVHRYAMLGRRAIDRMVLIAPGWYSLPDPRLAFPLGCGPSKALGNRRLFPQLLLDIATLVVVGDRDRKRDASLNTDPQIDRQQGRDRRSRARRFVSAVRDLAKAQGVAASIDFRTLPGASHNFTRMVERHGLSDLLFDWMRLDSDQYEKGAK